MAVFHASIPTPDCAYLWPHPLVDATAPATGIVVLPDQMVLVSVSPAETGGLHTDPAKAVTVPLHPTSARYWYHGGEHLEEVLTEALGTLAQTRPDCLARMLGCHVPGRTLRAIPSGV